MVVELPENVRVEVMATLFGISVRRVQQLTQEGILHTVKVKGQRGRVYPLRENVQAYIAHLSGRDSGSLESKQALEEARIAKLELECRALETRVQIQEGEVHTTRDVELVMNDMLGALKTRLWTLPQTATPRLVGAASKTKIKEILSDEVHALSALLSEYNPGDFYSRNPDYLERCEADVDEQPG